MHNKAVLGASVVLVALILGGSAARGAPVQDAELRTARVETSLPPVAPAPATADARPSGVGDELRDCAALVLVGGMLLGLAAAVRRTA